MRIRKPSKFLSVAAVQLPLLLSLAVLAACQSGNSDSDTGPVGGSGGQTDGTGGAQAGMGGGGVAGVQGGMAGSKSVDAGSPDSGPAPTRVAFGIDALVPNTGCVAIAKATDQIPQKLSDTGCVQKQNPREPAAGVISYGVASPLWSDGATKRRFMALPTGGKIKVAADGDWDLPIGTTLMKSFELGGQMLETRFLVRLKDGTWFGYTYQWPPNGTDGVLQGKDPDDRFVGDIDWLFPSRDNCLACHTEAAGRSLGLETAQLNSDFVYAGNKVANQLATLEHLSLFTMPIGDPAKLPALPNPMTAMSATKEARARSYLHANCAHCHRPGGEKEVSLDFRFSEPMANTKTCNVEASKTSYSIPGAKLIAPGSLEKSIISVRMHSPITSVRMPAIGSSVVDANGVTVVDAWISSLSACP